MPQIVSSLLEKAIWTSRQLDKRCVMPQWVITVPPLKLGQAAVELIDVSHTYLSDSSRTIEALRGVSFDVARGEFIAIVGPSGCGKTTLLNLIAGLLQPTRGSLMVEGKPAHEAIRKRRIGLVFQDPALLPWRDTETNVGLPLELSNGGKSNNRRRVSDLIRLVGLEGFEKNYPSELSGGMRSRASIARALSTSPAILLMDEPFGSLDEMTAHLLNLELLRVWNDLRPTVVMVTHSISQAVFMSDRVLILSQRPGRVVMSLPIELPRPRSGSLLEERRFVEIETVVRHALLPVSATEGATR